MQPDVGRLYLCVEKGAQGRQPDWQRAETEIKQLTVERLHDPQYAWEDVVSFARSLEEENWVVHVADDLSLLQDHLRRDLRLIKEKLFDGNEQFSSGNYGRGVELEISYWDHCWFVEHRARALWWALLRISSLFYLPNLHATLPEY